MNISGMFKTKVAPVLVICTGMFLLSGCMPGTNPNTGSGSAGFLWGLWHGLICPITLILSIFMDVNFYEVHNTGWWYNLGFLIGASATLGGSGRASNR